MYYFVREITGTEKFKCSPNSEVETYNRTISYLVSVDHGNPDKVVKGLLAENPNVDTVIPLRLTGKTYSERKQALIDLAIEIQAADQGGLSWNEVFILGDYFEENGKRYGCLEEFRENAIC